MDTIETCNALNASVPNESGSLRSLARECRGYYAGIVTAGRVSMRAPISRQNCRSSLSQYRQPSDVAARRSLKEGCPAAHQINIERFVQRALKLGVGRRHAAERKRGRREQAKAPFEPRG